MVKGQTDKKTDRQTDRQTNRDKCRYRKDKKAEIQRWVKRYTDRKIDTPIKLNYFYFKLQRFIAQTKFFLFSQTSRANGEIR
jgi:hypothetical protein